MNDLKECSICKISKIRSDYIFDHDECYRCEYARKVKEAIKPKKKKCCKLCEAPIPEMRWIYCSEECAAIAKRKHKHWTNKFKTDTKDWKKRFMGVKF